MAARRRDLERPFGAFLPANVTQIRQRARHGGDRRLGPAQHLGSLEMVGQLDEVARGDDVDIRRGPGGFRAAGRRTDQALSAIMRRHRRRQHPGYRGERAVEGEFTEHGEAVERIGRDGADRGHDAQRDRQVEMAALLGHVRRREIDGDALARQGEAG